MSTTIVESPASSQTSSTQQSSEVSTGRARTRTELLEMRRRQNMLEAYESSAYIPGSDLSRSVPASLLNNSRNANQRSLAAAQQQQQDSDSNVIQWPKPTRQEKKTHKNDSTIRFEDDIFHKHQAYTVDSAHDHYTVYRRRSALVEKRLSRSREVTDKPTNSTIVMEGGNSVGRVPLWKAAFWPGRNERSPLDDPNMPMYSSFSSDGIFRPEKTIKAMRLLMNKSEKLHRFVAIVCNY